MELLVPKLNRTVKFYARVFHSSAGTIVEKVKNFDPVTHDARAILDEVLCIVRRKSSR